MNSFVLKGHVLYNVSRNELAAMENAYLVCENGLCCGVFDALPECYAHLPIQDYGDKLIIPGMVDLHLHAPQYAFRGMCMDLELMDWLNRYTFPEEEKYEDLDYARKAYGLFVDGLRSGATSRACIFATRHREATVLLMDLMEKSGLISYVGKVNMDREATPGLEEESAMRSAFDTFGWINSIRNRFNRTHPILTPRFIPSCTDQLMAELREIQMTYGLPVQSHLSESPGEIDFVHYLRPQNAFYGEAYNDYDLFGYNDDTDTDVKTVMAHCVWSTAEEVKLMQKNGVFIAHCPASNMNLSSGIAPIRRYMECGMRVGLGSDVAGGHSDSIFRAIADAIQVSKMYWRYVDPNAKAITFPEAFWLATKGGGEFFGKVGAFQSGYEFDAVVLDDSVLPHPQELSIIERLERAVYLQLDMRQGVCGKYVGGEKLF